MQNKDLVQIFKQSKDNHPMILDGAMGSYIEKFYPNEALRSRVKANRNWGSLINYIDAGYIKKLHRSYLEAGANIITTNTFRTNPLVYNDNSGNMPNREAVRRGVELAIDAKEEFTTSVLKAGLTDKMKKTIMIAGSNPPAEDCYQSVRKTEFKYLEKNHKEHITYLMEAGVDFILNETQSHFDEIELISSFCYSERIPFVISFYFTEELRLLDGKGLIEAIREIQKYGPLAIGFNCISNSIFQNLLDKADLMREISELNWGYYLNCGEENYIEHRDLLWKEGEIKCGMSPKVYLKVVEKVASLNPSFVGTCCGSDKNHTETIYRYYYEKGKY